MTTLLMNIMKSLQRLLVLMEHLSMILQKPEGMKQKTS